MSLLKVNNWKLIIVVTLLITHRDAASQATFTKDIAPIIYNKCTSCHRQGEIGPFELISYENVVNRSAIIKAVIQSDYMPPWQPDPTYSNFLGEYYLTNDEKQTIIDWIDDGLSYGQASEEPPLPDFPEGSLIGQPDLVLEFEEEHLHKGDGDDEYRYFVLPTGLTEDKYIKAIELRPGNRQIVHHALFFEDTEGKAASYDAQTPEYGFEGFGGFGTDAVLEYDQYPGYVPGTKPIFYPDGLGQKMSAGSDLVLQMHYAPWPVDAVDKSKVNIFFADDNEVIQREVDDRIMLPFDLLGGFTSFIIPPNTVREFHGTWKLTQDRSLIGLSPHMHYLGVSWEVWLEDVDGTITNLIKIPEWDFNWQGGYYFQKLIPAMKGATIHAVAKYDNTANNPSNPSNPPKWVSWGEGTEDEMYYLPILSIPYQEGDENVIFSDPTSTIDVSKYDHNSIQPISPNPITDGSISIDFSIIRGQALSIDIIDEDGQLVRNIRRNEYFGLGNHKVSANMSPLSAGIYWIRISGKNVMLTAKCVKI